jgi:hypothetical protein
MLNERVWWGQHHPSWVMEQQHHGSDDKNKTM